MISKLQVTHLRNLSQASLSPSCCNVIIGQNGSGKTSLLESLFLLSRGKSFRTHQPKRYIQHHQTAGTVFARCDDGTTLGIQKKADATTFLKLNGDNIKTQSELTRHMPTLLIDPSSMDVLEQGSASRRQLLDWLAFHIKPGFYPQWLAYQRLLKQRNSLLKQTKSLTSLHRQQIQAWDMGLANHAQLIHHYREEVFKEWLPYFVQVLQQLLPKYSEELTVTYHAGFDTQVPLNETLAERLQQDLYQGYTRVGCHRADIHVHWKIKGDKEYGQGSIKDQAVNVLSRGEKKLLITALRLSQLPLLQFNKDSFNTNRNSSVSHETFVSIPVVLLDDITAELDDNAINILLTALSKLNCQVFITSLTEDVLPKVAEYWEEFSLFHVKQGVVEKHNNNTDL